MSFLGNCIQCRALPLAFKCNSCRLIQYIRAYNTTVFDIDLCPQVRSAQQNIDGHAWATVREGFAETCLSGDSNPKSPRYGRALVPFGCQLMIYELTEFNYNRTLYLYLQAANLLILHPTCQPLHQYHWRHAGSSIYHSSSTCPLNWISTFSRNLSLIHLVRPFLSDLNTIIV